MVPAQTNTSVGRGVGGKFFSSVCLRTGHCNIRRAWISWECVNALRWLAIIPLLGRIHQGLDIVLTGAGRQGVRTAAQFTAAALNFGLNLWLIPRHGWLGAAWASIATDGTLAIMSWTSLRVILTRSDVPA